MKLPSHLVVLSALAIAVGLSGCDSGPRAPRSQGIQPSGSSAPTSQEPRESAAAVEPKAGADLKNVHFDLDEAKIRSGDAQILKEHARWLKSRRNLTVMIGGHADERGSEEHNMQLGQRRANAVKGYLTAQGVDADRVAITSHGERSPACSDHTESCWSQNRRADFQVKSR